MKRSLCLATVVLALASPSSAKDRRAVLDANGNLDALITKHAAANDVPEELVRRVIRRESGGNPRAVSRGNYGLMQIRLGTARALGYRGSAAGLLDADTNMTYAVKYLAGAYRVAGGNANRAVHYYAAGYYYAAKRRGVTAPGSERAATRRSAHHRASPATVRARVVEARNDGGSVSSSSSLYTGKLDYH